MKNFSHSNFYRVSIALFALLFGCAACSSAQPIQLATPSPTSQYIHFTPSDKSVLNLQFDYPAEWRSQYYEDVDWVQFNLYDPTKLLPNADLTPPVHSDNSISISVVLGDRLVVCKTCFDG